jgi:hypothetical protein
VGKHIKTDLLTYLKRTPECAGSGFIPAWAVAPHYEVAEGVLREVGISDREYNPFSRLELPTELARIATGELSPVAFASEFGLLGHDALLLPETGRGGDPLDWVVAHSRTVGLFLNLIGLLEEDDEHALQYELKHASPGLYAFGRQLVNLPTDHIRDALKRNVPAAGLARLYIGRYITENILGITRRLQTNPQLTRVASAFVFRAMIETVYWQLANRLESGGVRRCAECRRFFIARDKRQQYCPPFPGSTRSRCSAKLNVQNFRSRQRGEL